MEHGNSLYPSFLDLNSCVKNNRNTVPIAATFSVNVTKCEAGNLFILMIHFECHDHLILSDELFVNANQNNERIIKKKQSRREMRNEKFNWQ